MQIVRNVNFMCSFVNFQINKVVVGSGCRDAPKYVGEGVALGGPHGESGRLNGGQHGPNGQFHAVFSHFYVNASMTLLQTCQF